MTKGMIKVSVLYPNGEGNTFDMNYYCNTHLPLVKKLLGDALKFSSVDKGMGGAEPGSQAPYIAIGHLFFDTLDAFQQSFGPNAEQIMSDIPNYTNTQPQVQINEVIQ